MKKLLLALGILALICSPAMAGRNAGGAIVLHNDSSIVYSGGWDYCGTFPLPPTCLDLNTNISHDPNVETLIWAVAAFPDGSSPGVTADQFGLYGDVTLDWFVAWGPCPQGALEVPDATWPAPGTGTAVAFSSPIYSQLFKLYWFAAGSPGPGSQISTGVYPHGSDGAGFADDSNPPQFDRVNLFGTAVWGTTGHNECPLPPTNQACCFTDGSCRDLTADECAAAGGITHAGVLCNTPGFQCPQPTEACCFPDHSCRDLQPQDCAAQGGTPQGPGSVCTPDLCVPPPLPEACCFTNGTCQDLLATDCTAQGGTPQGQGTTCANTPCPQPPTGACCVGTTCSVMTETDCAAANGSYHGDGTNCDNPNECITPTTPSTWGKIKAGYR